MTGPRTVLAMLKDAIFEELRVTRDFMWMLTALASAPPEQRAMFLLAIEGSDRAVQFSKYDCLPTPQSSPSRPQQRANASRAEPTNATTTIAM